MELSFEMAVRAAGDEHHRDQSNDVGNHDEQSDDRVREVGAVGLHNLREPEAEGVHRGVEKNSDASDVPDTGIGESLPGGERMRCLLLEFFAGEFGGEPVFFRRSEEGGVGGPAGQEDVGEHAASDRGNGFEHQQPAPTGDTEPVGVVEDETGKRGAENTGEGKPGEEEGDGLGLFALAKPVGEVEDDAGEVAGFGEAEKETENVELRDGVDEAGEERETSPG